VRPNELRVQNPTTGEVLLADRTTHEISVELPSKYFEIVWPTLVGVTDASSIIRAQFFYLVNLILLDWSWDFCHGQWNSIKNVCKSGDGSYQKGITEFAMAANFAYGPFGSGAPSCNSIVVVRA